MKRNLKKVLIMKLTIKIENKKARAFVDFIKTLEFIQIIEEDAKVEYELNQDQIEMLEERKQKHLSNESKSYDWDDIQNELRDNSK